MNKFKIGDRVSMLDNNSPHYPKGHVGIITYIGMVDIYGINDAIWLDDMENLGGGRWTTENCLRKAIADWDD